MPCLSISILAISNTHGQLGDKNLQSAPNAPHLHNVNAWPSQATFIVDDPILINPYGIFVYENTLRWLHSRGNQRRWSTIQPGPAAP
jgi:hypothetical protein